jgi:hypothetical protein
MRLSTWRRWRQWFSRPDVLHVPDADLELLRESVDVPVLSRPNSGNLLRRQAHQLRDTLTVFRIRCARRMNPHVRAYAIEQLKILQAVIESVAVFVMHQLCASKRSIKRFTHHQTVLKDVSVFPGIRMIWSSDFPIALWRQPDTAMPVRGTWSLRPMTREVPALTSQLHFSPRLVIRPEPRAAFTATTDDRKWFFRGFRDVPRKIKATSLATDSVPSVFIGLSPLTATASAFDDRDHVGAAGNGITFSAAGG